MNQAFMSKANSVRTTTRRPDAEAGVNLAKRRSWFTDPPPPNPAKPDPAKPTDEKPPEIPDWMKDPEKVKAEVEKLRSESAGYRTRATKAEGELTAKQTAEQQAADAKLKEQNEYKTLYEQEQAEKQKALDKAAKLELESLQMRTATEAGLPPQMASRLRGTTEDELKADAEALKGLMPAAPDGRQKPPPPTKTTPVPGGDPIGLSYEQRRNRHYNGSTGGNPFQG